MKKEITPSWCSRCLENFEMRYTPVEGTGLTLLFGVCDNCKVVTFLRILKDKEKFAVDFVPKEKRYKYDTNKSWNKQ